MKKKIYLFLICGISTLNAYQGFGPLLFSSFFLNDKGCKVSVAPTFSWWRIRRSPLTDTNGGRDRVASNHPKVVPGICLDVNREIHRFEVFRKSVEIKTKKRKPSFCFFSYGKNGVDKVEHTDLLFQTMITMGIRFDYQKRKKACVADFFEEGEAFSDFTLEQDVHNIRLTPYCQAVFDLKKFMVSISAGPSIHFKTFGSLEVWEKATTAYTGQRLEPKKINMLAEFDTALSFACLDYGRIFLRYGLTAGAIRYGRKIFIDVPGDNASEQFDDQLFLSDRDSIYMQQIPKLKLLSHTFSAGFEVSF